MIKKNFSIHFVGIKGVGMTPLAIIAKEAGFLVSGSDVGDEFITDEALRSAGIEPLIGFAPEHIDKPDLVVTTGAHGGFDNVEVKTARQKQIRVITAGDCVGLFMEGELFGLTYEGISVAGSHGKTTTTAMIATIFSEAGLDPSYIIGTGNVGSLGAPGHFGKGPFFIAEADEYANEPHYDTSARFLKQHPKYAVFTNIEFDHPDIYPTLASIRQTFLQFARQLPKDGMLIACGDDKQVGYLLNEYSGKTITYGFEKENTYLLRDVTVLTEQTIFHVDNNAKHLGTFTLHVPGEHNALNALAAALVCIQCGLSLESVKKGLLAFRGSKRRLEFIGELRSGTKVYDDYAHHPTEIKTTLKAIRKQYPGKQIVCIFQPHTYSRTKSLLKEFMQVWQYADTVLLMDIFASAREQPDASISSEKIVTLMKELNNKVIHTPEFADVIKYINQSHLGSDTVLVTMGAGDVYKLHSILELVQ